MDRREFIKILSAGALVPVIGLPALAPGAPAIAFTDAELAKIAEECLEELEEKEPFREYFRVPKHTGGKAWISYYCDHDGAKL